MRNIRNAGYYTLFTLGYAIVFSVGVECFLNILSFCCSVSLDSPSVAERYPRFFAFCLVVGLVALVALLGILLLNVTFSEKLKYSRGVWVIQFVCAFIISVPLLKLWKMCFQVFSLS